MITEQAYLNWLQCKKYGWLTKNASDDIKPKLGYNEQIKIKECNEVYKLAYEFLKIKKVINSQDKGKRLLETAQAIQNKTSIANATFDINNFEIKANVLKYTENGWDLYSVKAATVKIKDNGEIDESAKLKEQYIKDLTIQKILLEDADIKINKTYILKVNNTYIKNGDIEIDKMFVVEDRTIDVNKKIEEVKNEIENFQNDIMLDRLPDTEIICQCKNPQECDFKKYCWKNIPEDSIYNYHFQGKNGKCKKIENLLDEQIINATDVPEEILTNNLQKNYLKSLKIGKPIIEKEKIREELSKLKYPLYFLDYETLNPAIPVYDGYKPYQRIEFQYSLHIQESPNSSLEEIENNHKEFLSRGEKDAALELVKQLRKDIKSDSGSVIVWNKSFECSCNREMGVRYPEFKEFLDDVNNRVYDLMDIFSRSNGFYVDAKFHGSWSIKKVLPVLAPDCSYVGLPIHEGATASNKWREMVLYKDTSEEEKENIYNNLLRYCHLDTWAMVKILDYLKNII